MFMYFTQVGVMANVALPSSDPKALEWMQRQLDERHSIYMIAVSVTNSTGETIFFTRLSAQVRMRFAALVFSDALLHCPG